MPRIAISYRRADSEAITGRIFDRLAAHYGRDSVFRDIDSVPLGIDFCEHVASVFDKTDLVLAIVGPRWVGGRGGQNRLADPADLVRIEVETALRKHVPVIPILVARAALPRAEQLPDSLKDLPYLNGMRVDSGQDFDAHLERLIRAMDRTFAVTRGDRAPGEDAAGASTAEPPPAKRLRTRSIAAMLALSALLSGAAVLKAVGVFDKSATPPVTPEISGQPQLPRVRSADASRATESEVAAAPLPASRPTAPAATPPPPAPTTTVAPAVAVALPPPAPSPATPAPPLKEEAPAAATTPPAPPIIATVQPPSPSVTAAPRVAEPPSAAESSTSFRDCAGCPEMVRLAAGRFMMGSEPDETTREGISDDIAKLERPRHAVSVKPFAVAKYDVTKAQYAAFIQATGYESRAGCSAWNGTRIETDAAKSWRDPGFPQNDTDPVVCVSWDDANAYAAWLARSTNKPYRLLAEAEWEYAARAGTSSARYWGDAIGSKNANCDGCGSQWDNRSRRRPAALHPTALVSMTCSAMSFSG